MNPFKWLRCWWRGKHNDIPMWLPRGRSVVNDERVWCCISCGRLKPRDWKTWPPA